MKNLYAYTAGYIDGDGCFYVGKTTNKKTNKSKYKSQLVITSTNKDILNFFASNFDGSVYLSDDREKFKSQKPNYQFSLTGKLAVSLTEKILPYLTEKKLAAENLIKFYTSNIKDSCIEWHKKIKELNLIIHSIQKKQILIHSKTIKPSEIDYAYLAGFIDAECCLGVQHYKPKNRPNEIFKIILSCNNSKIPAFQYLVERWGGSLHFIDRKSKNENHSNQFHWKVTGKQLSPILKQILPFIRHKKPVCELLIQLDELTLPNGGDRHTNEFKIQYAGILKQKKEITDQIHKFNKKGIS